MRRLPHLYCCGVGLALLGALAASAGASSLAERWKGDLDEIDQLLISEQWKKAQKQIRNLRDEMYLSVVGEGQGWLATIAALSAVAYAGEGELHQARWMWDASKQLFPDAEIIDLEHYRVEDDFLRLEYPNSVEPQQEDHASVGTLTPPVKRKTPRPKFPPARLNRGQHVAIAVMFTIGPDGRPYNPSLIDSAGEYTMVFSALEALGKWRFTPAKKGGRPVAAIYHLTVNFKVR